MSAGAPDAALVNGHPSMEPWLLDRGLHFGDGVFETMSCRAGRPRFINLHIARLQEGCRRLNLPQPDIAPLHAQIRELAAHADACIVKLIVTRGEALVRGYGYTGEERATCILLRYPWPAQAARSAFIAGTANLRLGENAALAGIKHLNRLEQVLAQRECAARHMDELLMFSSSSRLVSGTMSNVFLVRDGGLLTPVLDLCGVAGIMRGVVIREAQRAGIPCEERALDAGDLRCAGEVFFTNSRFGVVAAGEIDGCQMAAGSVTRRIQALIAPMLENPVDD